MKIIPLLLLVLLFSSPARAERCHVTSAWEAMPLRQIGLDRGDDIVSIEARLADNASTRAAGYQWICPEQAQGTAVLFIFPDSLPSAFHMRNVYVPLDIHFFDTQGRQVDAMVMQAEPPGHPGRPRYYQASGPFRYALEIARTPAHDLQSVPAPMRLLLDSLN